MTPQPIALDIGALVMHVGPVRPAQVAFGDGVAAGHLVQPDGTRPDIRAAGTSEVFS